MTGTQLATRQNGASLATGGAQRLPWDKSEREALLDLLVPDKKHQVTDADLAIFAQVCKRGGFDPFLRQVYLLPTQQGIKIHIGIDGLRLIAQRSGGLDSTDGPYWRSRCGDWTEVWDDEEAKRAIAPLFACKYGVRRIGASGFIYAVVHLHEFRGRGPNWDTKPAHMLAIVAERHALRKGFQHELTLGMAQARVPGAILSADDSDEPGPPASRALGAPDRAAQPQTPVERAPAPPTGARRPVAAATVSPAAVTAPAPTRQAQMATLELGAAMEAGELEDPEPSTEVTQVDEDPEHAEALRHYVAAANKAAQARLPHLSPAQVQERSTSEIQDQTTLLLDALNAPQAKARR